MKKTLALILALTLILALFAGCNQTPAASPSPSQSSEQPSQTPEAPPESSEPASPAPAPDVPSEAPSEAPPAEPAPGPEGPDAEMPPKPGPVSLPLTNETVTFTFFYGFNPQMQTFMTNGMADNKVYAELENRTGIHIEFHDQHPASMYEKFQLMVAGGDYDDLMDQGLGNYAGGADKAVDDGVMMDMTDVIKEYAPNLQYYFDNYPEVRKAWVSDSGNIVGFGIINNEYADLDFGGIVRQDWLDDLNMAAPQTYDEYHDMLTAFKVEKGADAPLILAPNGVPNRDFLVKGYGVLGNLTTDPFLTVPLYQVDNKIKFGVVEDGFREYLTMMSKWYEEGLIYQDFISLDGSPRPKTDLIYANRSGLWFGDGFDIPTIEKDGASQIDGFKLWPIQDARKTKDEQIHLGMLQSLSQGISICVSGKVKEPELLVQYFDYMYSDEGSFLCNYGIEGEAHNMVDGKPVFTDIVTNNPDMVMRNALYIYCFQGGSFVMDVDRMKPFYSPQEAVMDEIWNYNTDFRDALPGTLSLTTEESEKYSNKIGDIITYAQESIVGFIMGTKPLSEWDSYVQRIYEMGLEECLGYQQAALDRYLAK